jgi:hypothetical protein
MRTKRPVNQDEKRKILSICLPSWHYKMLTSRARHKKESRSKIVADLIENEV